MQALLMFLVVNGFILVLCSLIAISSYFLKQSGRVRLFINENESGEADCGMTLFEALAEKNVFLPAACGGKGTCGRCLVKCPQGGGPLTPMERILLDEVSLVGGFRLACQIKVREDLKVELPPELLIAKKFTVRLEKADYVGEGIRVLQFSILNNQLLEFKSGQYVQVYRQLPHERIVRAYSISSDAEMKTGFSLDVQLVSGGLMSTWLHQIEPGTELEISGPYGEMALEDEGHSSPVILVAGGVGMAPMRSIIAQLSRRPSPPPVWLFWGTRHRAHLYAESELEKLKQQKSDWFRFFPALSGDLIEEGWTGDRGFIHSTIQRHLPEMPDAQAFICGPGPMMKAVTQVLEEKGLKTNRIKADPFDF
ncbi:MAG: FAD-binding oxidoreductase [Candidatus Rifleibacteriota bacterium]